MKICQYKPYMIETDQANGSSDYVFNFLLRNEFIPDIFALCKFISRQYLMKLVSCQEF
jgi:hypothetical protein